MVDCHLHSCFSGDCDAPLHAQIQAALHKGLQAVCITDHLDQDYTGPEIDFSLDTQAYLPAIAAAREIYQGQLSIYAGVELGLQPHLGSFYKDYCNHWPFDYVIGSTHLVDGQDPYYPEFWEGKSVRSCLESFFLTTLKNMQSHDCFDSYGHLDYIIRYIPQEKTRFSYFDYTDLVDSCLRFLVEHGKALEVNTGGYKAGLHAPNPGPDILRRYRDLGGELVTTGSDAHFPEYVGFCLEQAYELLKACGFRYVALYQQRKPQLISI